MHPIHIVYLNGPDLARLALDDAEILATVEHILGAQARGGDINEARVRLFPNDDLAGDFNVLPGVIRSLELVGVKVIGNFSSNFDIGLPREMGVLTLFDPATGTPLAILNAGPVTAMRAGATTALGAKYLARKSSKILAHLGADSSAYWNIRLLAHYFQFDEIRVYSKPAADRRALAVELSKTLGRRVIEVDDCEVCVRGADIVVEATRLTEPAPVLDAGWLRAGALVILNGTQSAAVLLLTGLTHRVVVDDSRGDRQDSTNGAPRPVEPIDSGPRADLGQIVAGAQAGRESDSETIVFWQRGLALSDIALAGALLDKAGESAIGQTLRFE
jgi:alanine dehydrogenase